MFEFERREGESAAAAGFRCRKKRKKQIEVNSPSSAVQKLKWARTVHTSYEIGNGENPLASTQKWRKLLCNDESPKNVNLVKSEEVFKRRFPLLLDSFEKSAENPAQCSENDAFSVYSKISGLLDSWEVQLLKENMVNTDGKDFWMIEKLEKKRDLVTNRLNLLTSVYLESLKFIKFSKKHKKRISSKFKELSDVQNTFSSMATMLKFKDHELNEARKLANECREELRKTQNGLKEAPTKFNESSLATELLKNQSHELNKARKQVGEYLEELRKMQKSLKEAHLKLDDLTPTNNPSHQVNPQVMLDKCLQDKETPGRQSESAVVDDFQCSDKRQIEENCPSSVRVKKFKWNGTTVYPSDEISNGENNLASTQMWRKLLFSNVSPENELLVKSEEIFVENVNVFLYGIEKCAANPAQWSGEDTNFFCNKIMSFVDSWKMQLLNETMVKIDGKDFWLKAKLEKNCELVTNRFNLLTSVYEESLNFMTFKETQLKGMVAKFEELNDVKNKFYSMATVLQMKEQDLNESRKRADEYLEEQRKAPSKFNESSLATELLKNQTHELNEARKQADEYLEELRKTQKSLAEAQLKLAESSLATELLKNKDHELNEARKLANDFCEELKKTQIRLKEAHVKLNDLLPTNNPLPPVDPQDKNKQLNELKQQLDWGAKKQKETEAELKETREQLQSFVAKSREMTHTKQKDTIKKLSEIQTSLSMINPNYRPSCEIENESLSKEEKMFQDIKGLLEYTMQSVKRDSNCKKNTTESALETNSSASLSVSEYEMHLVTQIAAFLKVTPFPVSSHSIHSYVENIDNIVDLQFVESLLRKFPSFFKEVAGAPGSMDKNWIYLDLKPVITI